MPLSRPYPGSTRIAGSSEPAEVFILDAAGQPAVFGTITTVGTATVTAVPSSATVVTLAALNVNRRGLMIYNDSKKKLFLKFGAGALVTDFSVRLAAQEYFELPSPVFTGIITGIWDAADGNARVTESTV